MTDRAETDAGTLTDESDDTPNSFATVVHEIAVPLGWRMGGHGDPIAVFGPEAVLVLELRADGSVTWRDDA